MCQTKHIKLQAECSVNLGGLVLFVAEVDPHTFSLAEPLKGKNNIKANATH